MTQVIYTIDPAHFSVLIYIFIPYNNACHPLKLLPAHGTPKNKMIICHMAASTTCTYTLAQKNRKLESLFNLTYRKAIPNGRKQKCIIRKESMQACTLRMVDSAHMFCKVHQPVGVTPLIVIPRNDLVEGIRQMNCCSSIHNR
jgi:hypothetical protein